MVSCFKKLLSAFLVVLVLVSLISCKRDTKNITETAETSIPSVGISMPTKSSKERWVIEGASMKKKLETLGYNVELKYAENDVQKQIEQIENFISKGVKCLVITAIDSNSLSDVLQKAKSAGISIIAYDRMIMNTDAISYFITFDNKTMGIMTGKYIKDTLNLDESTRQYTIEFFMGPSNDASLYVFYNGCMDVLKPYFDNDTFFCKTGRISFDDVSSAVLDGATCADYLNAYYANERLDICCAFDDKLAYECKNALENAGYKVGIDWPLITGQGAEITAIKNIINGSQGMSIFKDTKMLASKCTDMIDAIIKGETPEITDESEYNNGQITVPTLLLEPVYVDSGNYKEVLIDSGYYEEVQLK